jgi:hypothetical protein
MCRKKTKQPVTIDPIRLLISEGKLVRIVTKFEHGERVTKKQIARGPVAAISTTTKNRLQIDDETRHISLWVDESNEQTREIARACTRHLNPLSLEERRAWRSVHRLLEERIGMEVVFPNWFEREIADRVFVHGLTVRRYYPAFAEACKTVCLIRSFQRNRAPGEQAQLEVDFADYAITASIFDSVFVESLRSGKGASEETRKIVEEIVASRKRPVDAKDIAKKLKISGRQHPLNRGAGSSGTRSSSGRLRSNHREDQKVTPEPAT